MNLREEMQRWFESIDKKMDFQSDKFEVLQKDITLIKLSLAETITYQKQQRKEIDTLNNFAEKQKRLTNRIYGYAGAVGSIAALLFGLLITFAKSIFKIHE